MAHAQLSEVLWSMTIEGYLHPTSLGGIIGLAMMGSLWLSMTIGGLCLMEVSNYRDGDRTMLITRDNTGSIGISACRPSALGRSE